MQTLEVIYTVFFTGDKLYEVQKKEDSCHHEEDSVESLLTSNVQHKLSTIKEYLSTSPVIVPEINLTQFDDSVKDDALKLNDTFEEITRLLNQGNVLIVG